MDVIAYCCNPNHYHFILKQLRNKGIEKFMQRISTGYTMYFNKKNDLSGSLFQGRFKSTHIENNELLLHISVYVNCNSEIHEIEQFDRYKWCSFQNYMKNKKDDIINSDVALNQVNKAGDYKEFAVNKIKYFKQRKNDQYIFLE